MGAAQKSQTTSQITPLLAQPTARELLRVLAYPKFKLSQTDRERLLEDLLPWCETCTLPITPCELQVRDPNDQVFLELALVAGASVLVSGDHDLLALQSQLQSLIILSPAQFHSWLTAH